MRKIRIRRKDGDGWMDVGCGMDDEEVEGIPGKHDDEGGDQALG